jgi:hypothetical protein
MANNPNDTGLEKARKALVAEVLELREKERKTLEEGNAIAKADASLLASKVKQLKKVVELVNAENTALKELKQNYEAAEETINSMSELQEKLKHHLKSSVKFGVNLADSIGLASNNQKDGFEEASKSYATTLQSIAELAGLNKEDSAAIATKSQEIDNQIEDYKQYIKDLISDNANSYISEAGDIQKWVGGIDKKRAENSLGEVVEYLNSLKK